MSRHARIEEVSSDSDPSEVDASEYDYDPTSRFPLAARTTPLPPLSTSQALTAQSSSQPSSHLLRPSQIPTPGSSTNPLIQQNQTQDLTPYKSHQALYPVYFSSLHSRAQGRRVSKSLAVPNPLARDIADAVAQLGMSVLFEAGKIHPKDWANPGRVRVLVKKDGKAVNSRVHNKHHLYIKVGEYLQANLATEASVRRLKVPGLEEPDPTKPLPVVAVPRGWKINELVPLHSPARGGGGVNEEMLKGMMGGMAGMLGGGADEESSSGKPKKVKRKVIRA